MQENQPQSETLEDQMHLLAEEFAQTIIDAKNTSGLGRIKDLKILKLPRYPKVNELRADAPEAIIRALQWGAYRFFDNTISPFSNFKNQDSGLDTSTIETMRKENTQTLANNKLSEIYQEGIWRGERFVHIAEDAIARIDEIGMEGADIQHLAEMVDEELMMRSNLFLNITSF